LGEEKEEDEEEDDEAWTGDEADETDLGPEGEFVDKQFERNNATFEGKSVEWTAPEAPDFIRDGMSINDIKQGYEIGDCWFLAALSSLASRRERLSFVIQKRRNETADPESGYEFKFYKMGKWVTFKVDKYLPSIAAIAGDNEYWVPYCEKAYAKRYRTYDAINRGWGRWGLVDLTGGIAIKTEISWGARGIHELFAWLYDHQQGLLMTSGISEGTGGAGGEVLEETTGLIEGHEYSLLKLEVVKTNDGMVVQLLQLRNPWGGGEFTGDWSDDSDKWDTIAPEKREKLNVQREDGAFWMCYKDYVNLFSSFDVCLLPSLFNEKKKGPIFENESGVRGKFADDEFDEIKLKIIVTEKRNVYLQCLLDVGIMDDCDVCINLKDENGEFVIPRLPNNYKPDTYDTYLHNGYLFKLDVGEYTLIISYLNSSASAQACNPGTRWFVRTVGKGVTLQRINEE